MPDFIDTIYVASEPSHGYKPKRIIKPKVKTNKINLAEHIIQNHMYNMLRVDLIDDIVDTYISF